MALPTTLTAIELCAGVGMLGVGAHAAFRFLGHELRTVCYVEREAPAAAQLVALMEAGALDPAPVWSDLLTFDGAAWRGCVDLLIAGFPCQDLSIAGRRAGLDGKRSGLFFNILDIADACHATGLVLENVSAIATATATAVDETEGALDERAASRVVGELADRGWNAEWMHLSAADVGASHGRDRWFCIAWRLVDAQCAERRPQRVGGSRLGQGQDRKGQKDSGTGVAGQILANTECPRWASPGGGSEIDARWQPEPRYGDVDDAQRQQLPGQRLHPRSRPAWTGASDAVGAGQVDCTELANAASNGRHQRGAEPIGQQGRSDAAECGSTLANPNGSHLERRRGSNDSKRWEESTGHAGLSCRSIFAPGPLDPGWQGIVANRPDLAPAVEPGIRMLADGMAYLVDESRAHQLRQVGNGVVPLQAAAALIQLLYQARNI